MSGKRYIYAVNGFITLLFLGLIYAWSVFVGPLEQEFGWQRSDTSLTFSISMVGFCLGGLAGGLLSRRFATRYIMLGSAAFVLAGFLLSSGITTTTGLFVYYGVFCGFGVGIGYNATISNTMKWFPDKQSLISGILLMGFGFGGSIFGSGAVYMMGQLGWRSTFRLLGFIMGGLIVASSLLHRNPSEQQLREIQGPAKGGTQSAEDIPTSAMIRDRSFICYFLWASILSAIGLAVIGNSSPLANTMTGNLAQATMVAGLLNIFNGLGRLSFGFLYDIIGSKRCLPIITFGMAAAMGVLILAVSTSSLLILAISLCMTGLFFGGVTPINSAYISRNFGMKYYATNFSVNNLCLLISAFLGPYASGLMQTSGGGYLSTAIMLLAFCAAATPLFLSIKRHTPPVHR